MDSPTQLIQANAGRIIGEMIGALPSVFEDEGDYIGPYRLCARLGEGGFGVVWRAQQTDPVTREVALKIIKAGMNSRQVLARFQHERQALASMDHPGIAALLDAGASADGRPYFAMELVKLGEPITEWCDKRHLPIHERLRLFIQVCLAVHHAHQKGVIHRDLKPTNVLVTSVDSLPTPKVIDFGIATVMSTVTNPELTKLTQVDQLIGTPYYMSPEQLDAGQRIDTRSDIYALGVLLYELLTGTTPFAASAPNIEALKHRIRDDIPARPSTLMIKRLTGSQPAISPAFDDHMPGYSVDLDWITMRALEKAPERRYQSANELAEDLQRFLRSEPVLARPPNVGYIAGRWIRRNRTAFAAACLVIAAMVMATIVSLREASLAIKAQHRAEDESKRAKQNATFLTALLDRASQEIKQGRNPEALRCALEGSAERIAELTEDHELRLALLDQLAGIYESIGETKAMLPLVKLRASEASALHGPDSTEARAAEIFYLKQLMDHGARVTAPPLVLDLLHRLEAKGERGTKSWFEVKLLLIRSYTKLKQGKPALAAATECLEEAERQKQSGGSLQTVRLALVSAYELVGDFNAAEALIERCRTSALKSSSSSRHEQIELALAHVYWSKKDFAAGAEVLRRQLATDKKLLGDRSPKLIQRLLDLCDYEIDANQTPQAEAHAKEAIGIAEPQAELRVDLSRSLQMLASVQSHAGRHSGAIAAAREALRVAEESGNRGAVLKSVERLAQCQGEASHFDEAIELYEQHLRLVEGARASFRDPIDDLSEMASLRLKQGRVDDAMKLSLTVWSRMEGNLESGDAPEYRAQRVADILECYEAWRLANPTAPDPKALNDWREIAKSSGQ